MVALACGGALLTLDEVSTALVYIHNTWQYDTHCWL